MSLATLLSQTATVTPRTDDIEDEYGDVTLAAGTPVDYPCRLEQRTTIQGSAENTDGQNSAEAHFFLFLPAAVVITYLDAVDVEGVTYEVIGEPAVERSPSGPHHVVATLRRIQGG